MEIASKRHRFAFGFVLSLAGMVVGFAACTDSYRSDLSGSSSGSGGMSGGNGSTDSGNGFTVGSGSGCDDTCSNDLKRVVDCVGTTKIQCKPEEGCANAKCIMDPCKAAEVSQSSYGCDYYALKTAQRTQAQGACFAAFVANTWAKPVHLDVSYGSTALSPQMFTVIPKAQGGNITFQDYDPVAGIPVGEVAILFLSRDDGGLPSCGDKTPALSIDTGVQDPNLKHAGTGRGTAFHIKSDYPVVAYQIAPYGGAGSNYTAATLLLPTSAWGKNYVAVNAYKSTTYDGGGWPSLNILAYQDNTEVTILPKVKIEGGQGVASVPPNTQGKYTLKAGEFLQIIQAEELTGSPIESNQPVAVFGGADLMTVPVGTEYGDSAQQQLAPVQATGNEYAAVRYRNRIAGMEESVPWRLVGMTDDTTLTWIPSAPPGAPTTLKAGQVAEFSAPGPFVVKSQDTKHPFYVGGYMTGGKAYNDIGDPEWVNVTPPLQFLDNYVFFTDPTYPETSLVVVRTKSKKDGKFADVNLECLGKAIEGWQPIGEYEYTRVDLVTGNFQSVNNCTNGRQVMTSALPFGVTVWGWGATALSKRVSYAYPAGAGFQPINQVVVPPTPQ